MMHTLRSLLPRARAQGMWLFLTVTALLICTPVQTLDSQVSALMPQPGTEYGSVEALDSAVVARFAKATGRGLKKLSLPGTDASRGAALRASLARRGAEGSRIEIVGDTAGACIRRDWACISEGEDLLEVYPARLPKPGRLRLAYTLTHRAEGLVHQNVFIVSAEVTAQGLRVLDVVMPSH